MRDGVDFYLSFSWTIVQKLIYNLVALPLNFAMNRPVLRPALVIIS